MSEFDLLSKMVFGNIAWRLEKREYKLFGAAERHGSYEWTWYKPGRKPLPLVVLAMTPHQETPQYPQYQLEIWAGAEYDERYIRHRVAFFRAIDPQQLDKDPWKTALANALDEAASRAESLQPGDFTAVRFIRREWLKFPS